MSAGQASGGGGRGQPRGHRGQRGGDPPHSRGAAHHHGLRGERKAVSMIVGMLAYPSYNYKLPIIFPSRCSHPPCNGCARGASSSRGPGSTPPWRRGAASDSLGARSPGTAATRIKIATVIMKSVLSSQLLDKNLLLIICLHLINNRNL